LIPAGYTPYWKYHYTTTAEYEDWSTRHFAVTGYKQLSNSMSATETPEAKYS
jgi:hypothetical protein